MGVEFVVQNKNKQHPDCFERNWNIRNIMNAVLNLNRQLGSGVISYSFSMERHGSVVTIPNDAIRINPPRITEDAESLAENCTADNLFDAFIDAQSENHCPVYVYYYNDLIQFVSERITVDIFDPVTPEDEITDQCINDSHNPARVWWYIPNGPNTGNYVEMTFAESEMLANAEARVLAKAKAKARALAEAESGKADDDTDN